METPQKRKHHYVSKFYLNEFLDLRVEPPVQPYLWVYDKKTETIYKRAPKNIAYKTGFYDMTLIDGTITTYVEDFFARIVEAPSSKILKRIANQEQLSDADKLKFAMFIFYSHVRVPSYLNFMNEFYRLNNGLKNEMMDPEIRKAINEAAIPDNISTLEFMLELVKIFAPIICNMNWQFLMAPKEHSFITSDSPVILNDPKLKKIIRPVFGWTNPNIQLSFPLSTDLCFLGTWTKRRKLYRLAEPSFIRGVNFRTAFFSTRYIFASRPILLEREIDKLKLFKPKVQGNL